MDHAYILNRFDDERRNLVRDGEVMESLPTLTRLSGAGGSHQTVIWSRLDESSADAAMRHEIDVHRQRGQSFEWKAFSHDRPTDLLKRLERHGYEVGEKEAVLVLDLTERHAWIDRADTTFVVPIERPEQIADFKIAAEAIFGKDYTLTATELAEALRAESSQHRGYIGYADGKPVSVGRLYTHPKSWFGGLYGGGTVAEFRGRGIYRAVVAARARDAIRLGARYLLVDALPTSRPILERLGFEWLTDTWPCEWSP